MKAYLLVAGFTLALSTPALAQEMHRLPAGAARIDPVGHAALGDRFQPRGGLIRDAVCAVDPAITGVTLTKGDGGAVRVAYEVANRGRHAWASGEGQQMVTVRVTNGNTGRIFAESEALATAAAPRASMGRFSTPMIADAFDTFEFGGEVEVEIAYDPDIAIDGNGCNDDGAARNNVLRISHSQVAGFLGSRATSRTFR
ncbi:hypothetical protein [Brevundimonas sp.]|jgi:hypothetical protein|uniref:hypothetical protein n=1 Tax=Brevundimonas sp. TaxID=1871086 RepID=UPI002E0FA337|nr:hypothetical protein [Brevundimonas sp.]